MMSGAKEIGFLLTFWAPETSKNTHYHLHTTPVPSAGPFM